MEILETGGASTFAGLIESIATIDRMEKSLAALKAALIDQARRCSEAMAPSTGDESGWSPAVRARRELVAELGCALRIPERSAESLVGESQFLIDNLPATLGAIMEGSISWRHVRSMIDHASSLPDEAVAEFERAMLPHALTLTAAQFERRARRERERVHPDTIDARAAHAVDERCVEITPGPDAMSWLGAHLDATTAQAAHNRITDIARSLQGPDDPRTLTQLRADVLSTLLLAGVVPGEDPLAKATAWIRARVLVTVPALSMLGRSDEPAILEGYGPIDLETAMELAANAPSFTRLLTHPETGAVLSVGRDRYSPPSDLRTWLRVRDGTCRFPGCSQPARVCDIDHTHDWQCGGTTDHDNLAHLCPKHHRFKHQTRGTVRQVGAGVLEWTSATGRTYVTHPQGQLSRRSQTGRMSRV